MQWLIDIIIDLMWESIHERGIYRDRGSYSNSDFSHLDLTADGTWHELDLSSIIETNTKGVSIRFKAVTGIVQAVAKFRPHGTTSTVHTCEFRTQVANIINNAHFTLGVDADGKIDYKFQNIVWPEISIVIRGWWM